MTTIRTTKSALLMLALAMITAATTVGTLLGQQMAPRTNIDCAVEIRHCEALTQHDCAIAAVPVMGH